MIFSGNLINNKKTSKITLGTANFFLKDKLKKKVNKDEILRQILKYKVNFIDTSDQYGNGQCEEFIGDFLTKNKLKNKIFISTKFGQLNSFSPNKIQKSIDESLKRLKIEKIDIYYFHSGTNREFDNDKLWTILDRNLKQGKITKLGISLKTKYLLNNNLYQLKKGFDYGVKVINLAYNPFFEYAEKIFNNKRFSQYYKFTSRLSFSSGLIFERGKNKEKKKFFNNQQNRMLDAKQNFFLNNSDLATWCLNKILNKKKIHSTILGLRNLDQGKILSGI